MRQLSKTMMWHSTGFLGHQLSNEKYYEDFYAVVEIADYIDIQKQDGEKLHSGRNKMLSNISIVTFISKSVVFP